MSATTLDRSQAAPDRTIQDRIAAVRRFNRFYTQRIGVLREGWLDTPFSLTEARVLYEIGRRTSTTASEIGTELGLDAGYLSRILSRFHKDGLISKQVSPDDGRQTLLSMTARGRKAFAPLEAHTLQQVTAMLERLRPDEQKRLIEAMATIETLVAETPKTDYVLRAPRAGDYGWIVARHAVLYAQEYQWGDGFEGVCAQIVADFINKFDPRCERGWIAERHGEPVGAVLLAKDSPEVARIRLLLVEPSARGLGIGKHLVEECIEFARQCGYRRITLWTHSVLTAARRIYENAGFRLTSSEPRKSWGQDVVSEHWDLELAD
jgi:DNA-binding MarR family transcriptional regulator/N-acetylglutamate synthase-like GNAT family acetyltransferase